MTNAVRRIAHDTRRVFSTKWSSKELHVPAWAISAIIYITAIRSFVYGMELLFLGNASGANTLLSYVAIMGIPTWGVLMVGSVLVLILGLILRNTMIITIGALLCSAVWSAFGLLLCVGWVNVGNGGRFAIAALATAATWSIFFHLQLKSIRTNGVRA